MSCSLTSAYRLARLGTEGGPTGITWRDTKTFDPRDAGREPQEHKDRDQRPPTAPTIAPTCHGCCLTSSFKTALFQDNAESGFPVQCLCSSSAVPMPVPYVRRSTCPDLEAESRAMTTTAPPQPTSAGLPGMPVQLVFCFVEGFLVVVGRSAPGTKSNEPTLLYQPSCAGPAICSWTFDLIRKAYCSRPAGGPRLRWGSFPPPICESGRACPNLVGVIHSLKASTLVLARGASGSRLSGFLAKAVLALRNPLLT